MNRPQLSYRPEALFSRMALLEVLHVSKKEKDGYSVKDISFTQQPLQKIAVAGETGSGKTSLLKMIAGLLQPDEGSILFEGKKVRGPFDQLIPGHEGIAYLSQHFELRNNYWVHEILSYANTLEEQEAANLYRICRIDHLLNRRTDQLSGGEKQRIALTRLLIGRPHLLLLDEPFSNLDETHKQLIKTVTDDINAQLGISCIMVSHDAPDILPWAEQVLIMKDGQLLQQGDPETIYRQPVNEYCAGLFGEYNLLDASLAASLQVSDGKGKDNLLVRPEEWGISSAKQGLPVVVQQVLFMGSYYRVIAVNGKQLIKFNIKKIDTRKGDSLFISLEAGAGHWL